MATSAGLAGQDFFSIPELALRWRCSRGTVYNLIRGEKVLDFALPGIEARNLCQPQWSLESRKQTRAFSGDSPLDIAGLMCYRYIAESG
jgi:hypothetical protein